MAKYVHAHAHYAINAIKLGNTKHSENKLNTLVLSAVSSTLPETDKWYFFIVNFFLLPNILLIRTKSRFSIYLYAVKQQGELNVFSLVNLTES